ncbi:MAG: DUF4240 domain-containing protein [Pseudomonadota bacterium]
MDDATFWALIERARTSAASIDERPEALRNALNSLEPTDIQAFAETYAAHVYKAYTWPLWGAAYVMNGGCSDDGFDYFRDWLISTGHATYTAALADPESLAAVADADEFELEEFRYVAFEVYEAKTGRAMEPDYPPYPGDPVGEPWDEDTVDQLFPKLAAKYW